MIRRRHLLRTEPSRGATRCALLCYFALVYGVYLAFVRAAPSSSTVASGAAGKSASTIQLVEASHNLPARFEVQGLPVATLEQLSQADTVENWHAAFVVSVKSADREPLPMLGTYAVRGATLVFEPRFPPAPGVTYVARVAAAKAASPVVREFAIPKPRPAMPTVVQFIFPSSSELPENQLKFYVFFSAPMSRGQAYRHVRLVNEQGKTVAGAFLEIAEELWDPTSTRLTLLMDPGRVKRGLKPREEDGPILEEGHRYTLEIDRAWPDAAGFELQESIQKQFRVLAPDDEPLDTVHWKIESPNTSNNDTLSVLFPEPVDRALLERVVWVETSGGQRVAGTITIDRQETRWQFRPAQPWNEKTRYALAAERILEDRAGNRIGRKFEVDVFEKIDRQVQPEIIRLPFRIER